MRDPPPYFSSSFPFTFSLYLSQYHFVFLSFDSVMEPRLSSTGYVARVNLEFLSTLPPLLGVGIILVYHPTGLSFFSQISCSPG